MPQRTPADFYARFYATSKLNTCWSYAHKIPWWPFWQNVLRIFLGFHPHSAMLQTNFERETHISFEGIIQNINIIFLDVIIANVWTWTDSESFSYRPKNIISTRSKWRWSMFLLFSSSTTPLSEKNQSVWWPVWATEESSGGWIEHNLTINSRIYLITTDQRPDNPHPPKPAHHCKLLVDPVRW